MDTNIRLSDGNSIPQIGYGVWRLEDEQAALLVGRAIDSGYRHIDTAQGYNNESGVGQAVASAGVPRNDLYVTSKLRTRDQGYDNALRSFEESLTRLRLDYLDLFLIHWPMPVHDRYVETWKALIKLKADGRVRSIGVSNFNLPHLERLVDETGVAPAVNQVELHPYYQQRDLRQRHAELGIAIESYSPLGGNGAELLRHPSIGAIARRLGRSPAQIVLRWHLQEGLIPLPKTATVDRLPKNLSVWDFTLDDTDIAQIDALDHPDGKLLPLPDDMNDPF